MSRDRFFAYNVPVLPVRWLCPFQQRRIEISHLIQNVRMIICRCVTKVVAWDGGYDPCPRWLGLGLGLGPSHLPVETRRIHQFDHRGAFQVRSRDHEVPICRQSEWIENRSKHECFSPLHIDTPPSGRLERGRSTELNGQ